jgi:chromosomal replication initiator protein
MKLTADDVWAQMLEGAKAVLPEPAFRTWLAPTRAVAISEDLLVVSTPNPFAVEWVEKQYAELLTGIGEKMFGRRFTLSVQFQVNGESAAVPPPPLEIAPPPVHASSPPAAMRTVPLNPRYTFDRFVVGNNNQLAAAAAHAVAEAPARHYNPLFIYSGVGLGKTHLMHAIGHAMLKREPGKRVMYLSSERFTNELVSAIQEGSMAEFRRQYRQIDLLLVDDIQFLEGKERTQEEFFHTFNALHDAQRQIVLTSDRPPKEIGLEDRLVSRFEWGLVADIKAPDFETRMAILRRKVKEDGLVIHDSEDVLTFIARNRTSSVREIEGALLKLLAVSGIWGRAIDLELARETLQTVMKDIVSPAESTKPLAPIIRYAYGRGIADPTRFYGRKEVLADINSRIDAARHGYTQDIAIVGERRIGKTSLLRQIISQQNITDVLPVFIDAEMVYPPTTEGFLSVIAKTSREVLAIAQSNEGKRRSGNAFRKGLRHIQEAEISVDLKFLKITAKSDMDTFAGLFRREFEDILKGAGEKLILLILDEVDLVTRYPEGESLLWFLRGLIQEYQGVMLIASGSEELYQLTTHISSPFFNIFQIINLGPLSEKEARSLVVDPMAEDFTYSEEAIEFILEATGRKPFYMQALCATIIQTAANSRRLRIESDLAAWAYKQTFEETVAPHLQYRWDKCSETEQQMLLAAVQLEVRFSGSELYAALKDSIQPELISKHHFMQLMKSLVIKGMFAKTKSGSYKFADGYVADWARSLL